MEPPFINDSTFSSYSFSEIWPLPHFPPDTDNNSTLTNLTIIPPHRRKRNLSPNLPEDCGNKHMKVGGGGSNSQDDENGAFKGEQDEISVAGNILPEEENAEPPSEPPKQDYIHVRARRGQATDSHSLAERARREKISERMKILQDLVPGCNKVIGKALVLDEIINYVQSLQRQVEFLSLKLEAVTSRTNLNPTIECFPSKDVGAQPFDLAGIIFGPQAARGYTQGSQPGWLHMQIAGSFDKAT